MEKFGLSDRLITTLKSVLTDTDIDYIPVHKILDKRKAESITWLKEKLKR